MKKNSKDGRKVVVCTCRRAAWKWIKARRLYNLPLPADEECCQCENVANGQSQLPIGGRDALVASATVGSRVPRDRAANGRDARSPSGRAGNPLPAASPYAAVASAAGSFGVSELGRARVLTRRAA